MKRLKLPDLGLLERRSLVAGAVATAVGLVLWGTAQTTEPVAGEGPQLAVVAAPEQKVLADGGSSGRIDFPQRRVAVHEGASLFTGHSWYVPPPPPPAATAAPPPAPTAPPLPFAFLGSYGPSGGGAVYYLVRGDQVLDVKVGDIVDGVYSIDAMQDDELLITYLPLKQRQALSLRR